MSGNDPFDDIEGIIGGVGEHPFPDAETMVAKGIEILSQSPMSFPLVEIVEQEQLKIHVIHAAREASYVPDGKEIYIGVTKYNPTQPARFVLLLADALLDVSLDKEGFTQPLLTEVKEKYISKAATRKAKKIAHLCAIAFDLDQKEQFSGYRFVDAMHEMGHNEAMDVFVGNI